MKVKRLVPVITLLIIAGVLSVSWAAAPTVYVKNKAIGTGIVTNGNLYVELEKFLRTGGYSWKLNGQVLAITEGGGQGPAVSQVPAQYSYRGNAFNAHTFKMGGKNYVLALNLSGALGLANRFSPSVNAYDFFDISSIPPSREAAEPPADKTPKDDKTPPAKDTPPDQASPDKGATDTKDGEAKLVKFDGPAGKLKDSAITPKNDFFYDFRSGEVRGSVLFANTTEKKLSEVVIVFKICDGYNKSLWTKRLEIGGMNGGASTGKTDYYWVNPSNIEIMADSFQYEITYKDPGTKK
jgi:hypothetical protein